MKVVKTVVITNPEVIVKLEKLVKAQQDFKERISNIKKSSRKKVTKEEINNIAYIEFKIEHISLRLFSDNKVKIKYKDEQWEDFNWENKSILTTVNIKDYTNVSN